MWPSLSSLKKIICPDLPAEGTAVCMTVTSCVTLHYTVIGQSDRGAVLHPDSSRVHAA